MTVAEVLSSDSEVQGGAVVFSGTRPLAGPTQLHVLADARHAAGFEPAAPDLEDVYFSVLFSLAREERIAC